MTYIALLADLYSFTPPPLKGAFPLPPPKKKSNQYWSPIQPLLVDISDQYYFAA